MLLDWPIGEVRPLALDQIGQAYRRYRLASPESEAAMASSLRRYGQIAPVVVCRRQDHVELLDGFKRLSAARSIKGLPSLSARLLQVDERAAKAAIYGLNQTGRRTQELEEAWIVRALVREDGLSQLEVAELLGRHKSWVCRRLALLEKLCDPVKQDLRVGLISPTMARELTRLPAGNQVSALSASRRESLTAGELRQVVDLLLGSSTSQQQAYVLAKPREALRQAQAVVPTVWDPRLSRLGNRISRRLGTLLDQLSRMEAWLRHGGRAELSVCDLKILSPGFARLSRDGRCVSELAEDVVLEEPVA